MNNSFKEMQVGYYAHRHDRIIAANLKRFLAKRLKFFQPYLVGAKKILEVGCGHGHLGVAIINSLASGARIYGIDLSYERLRSALEQTLPVLRADACLLPFRNEEFDTVFGNEFLHHIHKTDRETAIRELMRVTRAGGYIMMIEPNRFHPLMVCAGICMPADRGVFGFSIKETIRDLKRFGASDVHVLPFNCFTYPTRQLYPEATRNFFEWCEDRLENRLTAASRFIVVKK